MCERAYVEKIIQTVIHFLEKNYDKIDRYIKKMFNEDQEEQEINKEVHQSR